jgi:hypothetical protein
MLNITGDLTISSWFYSVGPPNFRTSHTIVTKRSNNGNNIPYLLAINYQYGIWSDYKKPIFVTATPNSGYGFYQSNIDITNQQWSNLTSVISGSNLKIYLNGNLVLETTIDESKRAPNFADLLIGSGARLDLPAEQFVGSLDDIAIYNRALTQEEINKIYNSCPSADSSSFTAAGCNSYTLPWGDSATASGTYTHTYTNATGCDSVVTANISIHHAEVGASMNLSGVGPYILPWGQTVNSSGYYSHAYQNQYGCDSLVTAYVVVEFPSDSTRKNIGVNVENPQRNLHIKDVLRIEPRNTPPTNPSKGDIYFDGTTDKLRIFDGSAWRDAY